MKRIIAILIAVLILLLVSCDGGAEAPHVHNDVNGDGVCDTCEASLNEDPVCAGHTDANRDGKCDACGESVRVECASHEDKNTDSKCDVCGKIIRAECIGHRDTTGDGRCDICGETVRAECTSHEDGNGDGKCDACGETVRAECTSHEDGNGDGKCDACGETVRAECTNHEDENSDGKCDACGETVKIDCIGHEDENDDGKCDNCSISVIIVLDFYAINDLHGKFSDTDDSVGVDELTTYLKNAYLTDDNTILLSSGDMWQGSSESNLTKGLIITEWMNELDFASMTLGNHEFDWGTEYVESNAQMAEFPMLAINIYDRATNTIAPYCQPSVMIERGGIKIGIIGAIGDCYSSISSSMVSDVYFKTGSQLTELVKAESERLRAAGAELIVYSLHDGYGSSSSGVANISSSAMSSYYDTALSNGYVDVVFEGHTHQSYVHLDNYGIYHLQNGGDDDGISHIEITLNFVRDSFTVSEAKIVRNYEYSYLEDDPIVDILLDKYDSEISDASEYLGKNNAVRNSEYLKNLVADLYYKVGMEKWGDEYDIVLGGGFISVRSPYDLSAGDVFYGDLMSLLPFDNEIVLCSISGYKLKYQFLETDNENYYIEYGEYGESIRNNINMNATYYVVTDRYSLDYSYNGLTLVDTYAENVYARDLVADYIKEGNLSSYKLTDISYIIELVSGMNYNVSTESFYIKGEIVGEPNATYGNVTLRGDDGAEIYVYGIWGGDGSRFDYIADKPKAGDTVILYGPAVYYRNSSTGETKIEMNRTTLVEIVRR